MKVMKFGGASFRNAASVDQVINAVKRDDEPAILVLSALFGMTDCLEQSLSAVLVSEQQVRQAMTRITTLHTELAEACIPDSVLQKKIVSDLQSHFQKLERIFYGVNYTEEITPKIRALAMSFGERLSVLLFAGILEYHGVKSRALMSDEIGVITDSSYLNAAPVFSETRDKLQKSVLPLLQNGITPVITGYFGRDRHGRVTLLGRNSSDYSAAVITAATGADRLEIWKDVNGFLTADPRMVENTRLIPRLSYHEAAELSYFGAKILHPRSVQPLIESEIPLFIKNLADPAAEGTRIGPYHEKSAQIIKSVTYNRQVSVLKIEGTGVGIKPGIIAEIGQRLLDCGINIYSIVTSQTCINLLLSRNDAVHAQSAIEELKDIYFETVTHVDDQVLIAVVGEGLIHTPGMAGRVFSAVARSGVNLETISAGASEVAAYFLVREEHLQTTIRSIHNGILINNLPA